MVTLVASILYLCYFTTQVLAESSVLAYLQTELSGTSTAQLNIAKFLHQKHIPIGLIPRSLVRKQAEVNDIKSRIALSTEDNNIECRIALGKATVGSKCVAPCGCIGSQKWIQFSVYNKLRRKDPLLWKVCQTCQQKFESEIFTDFGGLYGNILGLILDNRIILRIAALFSFLLFSFIIKLPKLIMKFLVSKSLWQLVSLSINYFVINYYTFHLFHSTPTFPSLRLYRWF